MVQLISMTQEAFETFKERCIKNYAESKVKAGNWDASNALELSAKDINGLLSEGLHTQGHFLFTILDTAQNSPIGTLWLGARSQSNLREIYIFDFYIDETYRGMGYGKQSMKATDQKAKELGAEKISLHVFGYNKNAIALYEKMGYEATNINMSKSLV